jgi:hypothetical protein
MKPFAVLACVCILSGDGSAQLRVGPPAAPAHVVAMVAGGTAEFKRQHWTRYAPARLGTIVRRGDLIRLGPSARVLILCDGSGQPLQALAGAGVKAVPCGADRRQKPWIWDDDSVIPTAQIHVPSSNLWASAMLAKTFDATPWLTWADVPGASGYEVEVTGQGINWKSLVQGNELMYPAEAPTLKPNAEYHVTIHSIPEKGSAASMLFMNRLSIVPRPSQAALAMTTSDLERLALPKAILTFFVAKFLALNGQHEVAIRSLESIRRELDEPAIVRELGDVHLAAGNTAAAQKFLAEAITLFSKNGDTVGHALAEEALASLESRTAPGRASAVSRLRAALAIYTDLGDQVEMTRINGLLAELAKPPAPPRP